MGGLRRIFDGGWVEHEGVGGVVGRPGVGHGFTVVFGGGGFDQLL